MDGARPVDAMWAHHVTFGSDLLAGPVEITCGAKCVIVDSGYDPAANSLLPGAEGDWPMVEGKAGPADLSKPAGPLAAMAYLHDFRTGWSAIRRVDGGIAAALSGTRIASPARGCGTNSAAPRSRPGTAVAE